MSEAMGPRVALVTGAGRGVGLGIARTLASEGFAVAVNDFHPERSDAATAEVREAGGIAMEAPFDVTDRAAVDEGIEQIRRQIGPVDVLVNNAGIAEGNVSAPFLESDPARWMPTFELNLFGSMNCIHATAPSMVERRWGRIVQISSGASSRGLRIGVSLYGAAKAGIEGLLRHLSVELAPSGVTCNALALGLMDNVGSRGRSPQLDSMLRAVPVGRLGKPEEVGAAVAWLASEGGGFVTGQVIHINGGSVEGR